ncbi:MAG: hypothetical protein ACJ74J_22340 [Blastocatellia bacterium]
MSKPAAALSLLIVMACVCVHAGAQTTRRLSGVVITERLRGTPGYPVGVSLGVTFRLLAK